MVDAEVPLEDSLTGTDAVRDTDDVDDKGVEVAVDAVEAGFAVLDGNVCPLVTPIIVCEGPGVIVKPTPLGTVNMEVPVNG